MNIICLADGVFRNVTEEIYVNNVIFFDGWDDDILRMIFFYKMEYIQIHLADLRNATQKLKDRNYTNLAYPELTIINNVLDQYNLRPLVNLFHKKSDDKIKISEFVKQASLM